MESNFDEKELYKLLKIETSKTISGCFGISDERKDYFHDKSIEVLGNLISNAIRNNLESVSFSNFIISCFEEIKPNNINEIIFLTRKISLMYDKL